MYPAPNSDAMLQALAEQWAQHKAEENDARAKRLAVENDFAEIIDLPEDGTIKVAGMKVHTGYTRKWDQEKLAEIEREIRAEFFPFKTTYKEDRAFSRKLEKDFPDLWEIIAAALTLTPSKPSFSVLPPSKD